MRLFKRNEPAPETIRRLREIAREQNTVEGAPTMQICPVKTKEQLEEEKWERRRWDLVRILVMQERRSVVLGKLKATSRAIAGQARELADATINELRNNPRNFSNGN